MIPVPEGTRTHQPLSHFGIVEVLEETLAFRHLRVVKDEYAVSADGMKMFGVMELNSQFSRGRFSIGLRNSNDKSLRFAMTAGLKVTVCDNLAFSGDFTPLNHKHTRNLELRDSISIAVDRIQRNFETLEAQVSAMTECGLTDNEAKLFIYRAFLDRALKGVPRHLMFEVHDHYFNPRYDEFGARNLWSLSNAFTSAFKSLKPLKQYEVTARLGAFFASEQVANTETIGPGPKPQLVGSLSDHKSEIETVRTDGPDNSLVMDDGSNDGGIESPTDSESAADRSEVMTT